jgi:putative DNA primase/helicase
MEEETLHAYHLARVLCRKAEDAKNKTVAAVVSLARTDRRQAATPAQWDANSWLLGTPKGTVDLRTGKLSAPRPADYITKIVSVVPSEDPPRDSCPRWLTFINRVTKGDEKLQDYLQRVCGYSLTGDVSEDAIFFAYGKGQNGKTVFLNTVSRIAMNYHETASMDMFVVSKFERHPTDLAQLRAARLVTAVETEEGKRWDEAKLKYMSGREPITARYMRQDPFTYSPQFKLLFAGNHKPAIRNVDKAIARRMNLIPFLVTIPDDEVDKGLEEKLVEEHAGILRWMIDGCLDWQKQKLNPPKSVTGATTEYLESQDVMQSFFDDACVIEKTEFDTFEHLWLGFVDWCEHCREYIGTKKAFGQKLKDKEFQTIQMGRDRALTYLGIRCIRENAKALKEEAARKTEEARKAAPPDTEPE